MATKKPLFDPEQIERDYPKEERAELPDTEVEVSPKLWPLRHVNVNRALFEVQRKLTPFKRDAENPHFKSSYTDLSTVITTLGFLFQEAGLVHRASLRGMVDGRVCVSIEITHVESGETLESYLEVPVQRPNDPQAIGSAITYARRYGLMALVGAVSEGDDDDANAAAAKPAAQAYQRPTTPRPAAAPARPAPKPAPAPAKQTAPAEEDPDNEGLNIVHLESAGGKPYSIRVHRNWDGKNCISHKKVARLFFGAIEVAEGAGYESDGARVIAEAALTRAANEAGYEHYSLLPWKKVDGRQLDEDVLANASSIIEMEREGGE